MHPDYATSETVGAAEWAGSPAKDADAGPVTSLVMQAQKGLESLHGSLARLEDRLVKCLREDIEMNAAKVEGVTASQPRPIESPLTRDLDGIVRRIDNAEKRIEELRNRVEL